MTKENEYRQRINKAIDYIETHYADELSLDMLAETACFSKYHFHRVFASLMGETLFEFIQRIKLQKAATKLNANRDIPIADIAYDCGFSSPSVFARAFKEQFGMSASDWRESSCNMDSNLSKQEGKTSKTLSNKWQLIDSTTSYFCNVNNLPITKWSCKMLNTDELTVEVKECEPFDVMYVRHIGPYKGDSSLFGRLFGQVCNWAGPRGLIVGGKTKFLCVYYDDPEITEESKLRLDVALSVPTDTKVDAPFGKSTIPGGKYAVCLFNMGPTDYQDAWNFLYGQWLPQSGYQPDSRPCFENYLSSPADDPNGYCQVEIYVPVVPL